MVLILRDKKEQDSKNFKAILPFNLTKAIKQFQLIYQWPRAHVIE